MTKLPSFEEYNQAFQHPEHCLTDLELRKSTVKTSGLGLPQAISGGFALTYTLSARDGKYAVRCFHKTTDGLETRYRAISNRMNSLCSPYFLDFEFQSEGIAIEGQKYPLVKMAWSKGVTLGEFLERHHKDRAVLDRLIATIETMASYLETQGIAHGDIQPGNVMVLDDARSVQLIDYDGMFVPALAALGSSEIGHRNFQHPQRNKRCWNSSIDRFSFIVLLSALRVLRERPELWNLTGSDPDGVIFRANDYADPPGSIALRHVSESPGTAEIARRIAAVSSAPFDKIPSISDFFAGRNIPLATVTSPRSIPGKYISSYPVVDGSDYYACRKYVGQRIELIGRVYTVSKSVTRADARRPEHRSQPYVHVFLGDTASQTCMLYIWSESLKRIPNPPDKSWSGKWVSAVGLVEEPWKSFRIGINISHSGDYRIISEDEAKFRLASKEQRQDNKNVLRDMGLLASGAKSVPTATLSSVSNVKSTGTSPSSNNAQILQQMKNVRPAGTSPAGSVPPSTTRPPGVQQPTRISQTPTSSGSGCLLPLMAVGLMASMFLAWLIH